MNTIAELQQTKQNLDKLLSEKRAIRLNEQLDLNIALISELPKEITAVLTPLIDTLIQNNNAQLTEAIEKISAGVVEAIKGIVVQVPEIHMPEINIPNISAPIIPEIKLPNIVVPAKDMSETNKILTEISKKKTPETDLKETNALLKKVVKGLENITVDFNIE